METTEMSLLPQMSAPVARKLFDASPVREDGASVTASKTLTREQMCQFYGGHYCNHITPYPEDCSAWCRDARDFSGCVQRCNARKGGGYRGPR